MKFEQLGLHPKVVKAVTIAGYENCTEVQGQAIPYILEGHDLKVSAQTGTGKTAAFLLPLLSLIASEKRNNTGLPRALVLVPTRELALQIQGQAQKYGKFLPFAKSVCVYGGTPYPAQIRQLKKSYDILIATPGRLIDLLDRNVIDLSAIQTVVLDEADRMLDMGFVQPVERIVSETPESRQVLLFSATMRGAVGELSKRLLRMPVTVAVQSETARHELISQALHYVDDMKHKDRLLNHILSAEDIGHTIVFTSTKRQADQLANGLQANGYRARALHGDMNQRQRTRTIEQLRNGKISILVATDVAARGIDVQSITHVINYDLPRNVEDYVHRIGRTGRAGATGTALSFAAAKDAPLVKRIESFTGQPIDVQVVAGFEPTPRKRTWRPARRPNSTTARPQKKRQNKSFAPPKARRKPYAKLKRP